MGDISGFLGKFKKILHQKEGVTNVVIDVVKEVAGISIKKENFKIKGTVLFTNVSGGDKGQLFISKRKIIEEVNSRAGKNVLTNLL